MTADPVLLEVVRGGHVEGAHRARVVVVDPDGEVVLARGDVAAPMFPRSATKPMLALGMLRAGLDLDGPALALACASHDGEDAHVAGVEEVLAGAGLTPADLGNIVDLPGHRPTRERWIREGRPADRLAMNCSGKHAAMLRTCARAGWPLVGYLDPDHPAQRAGVAGIAELTGAEPLGLAVDGCGAPAALLPLTHLARAFGRLAAASEGPVRRVADAMRAHPTLVSGTTRDEPPLFAAVPGLVAKIGAEAVHAIGLGDGTGIAIKIIDGGERGRAALAAALVERVAAARGLAADVEALRAQQYVALLGGGREVGRVRVVGLDGPWTADVA